MTIHTSHPFADGERIPERQFRARLGGRVSLWAAGEGRARAGLTVTSLLVAGGEPWRVVGLLDPDADVVDAMQATGVATVALLSHDQQYLADAFAGLAPAPGGAFRLAEFTPSDWGPVPPTDTWLGVRVESMQQLGWSTLATCTIEHAEIGPDPSPLHHLRGAYRTL